MKRLLIHLKKRPLTILSIIAIFFLYLFIAFISFLSFLRILVRDMLLAFADLSVRYGKGD